MKAPSEKEIRQGITLAWVGLAISGLLLAWQFVAYLTENVPGHILPLVRLLAGTMESVPVAYMWTLQLGLMSALGFLGSLIGLAFGYFWLRQRHRRKICHET